MFVSLHSECNFQLRFKTRDVHRCPVRTLSLWRRMQTLRWDIKGRSNSWEIHVQPWRWSFTCQLTVVCFWCAVLLVVVLLGMIPGVRYHWKHICNEAELHFFFPSPYLKGNAWIGLVQQFYPTDCCVSEHAAGAVYYTDWTRKHLWIVRRG